MNRPVAFTRFRFVRILGILLILWFLHYLLFSTSRSVGPQLSNDKKIDNGEPLLTVVVAGSKQEDASWIKSDLQRTVQLAVYIVDDPKSKPRIPKNKGGEAMVYLSYIIDNYKNLPEIMVFMRAQRQAQYADEYSRGEMPKLLERLRTSKIIREGYFNLLCTWEPGCPDRLNLRNASASAPAQVQEAEIMRSAFRELMPAAQVPEWLAQPGGGQFAASRDKIQSVPLGLWKAWRSWLLRTPLSDEQAARVWEYLWQFALAGKASMCPVVDQCYCEGYGVCFMSPTKFAVWRAWSRETIEWTAEYDELKAAGRFVQDLKDKIDSRNDILKMALDAAMNWGDELHERGDEHAHYGQRPTEEEEKAMYGSS